MTVTIKEVGVAEVVDVHARVSEFDHQDASWFQHRVKGKEHLALIAAVDGVAAGYLVAYDRFGDGSLYCWMTGTVPEHRRKGVLRALMDAMNEWARTHGYERIKVKTRNNRREMLSYLVKEGYVFTDVRERENPEENRILTEKPL